VGIAEAEGEFIVLLNDDTEILGNNWIEMLMLPFSDPSVGITGPIKLSTHFDANRFFLVNFCVMLKREVFNKVGPFDELFSPGAGEDTDFSLKAVDAGYKLVQVPEESKLEADDKKQVMIGSFPIYHRGGETLGELSNWLEIVEKNRKILEDRYLK
jgi:GT2 family glycosyltransferase